MTCKNNKRTELQLTRLKVQLQKVFERDGVQADESLHDDLKQWNVRAKLQQWLPRTEDILGAATKGCITE